MIFIDAVYINQSGGKVLLDFLINNIQIHSQRDKFYFLLDQRLEKDLYIAGSGIKRKFIFASEKSRRKEYQKLEANTDTIFCFANIPPPVRIKDKRVLILFHNVILLSTKGSGYGIKDRLMLFFKRVYILIKKRSNYVWIVQTNTTSKYLSNKLRIAQDDIKVIPFFDLKRFEKLNFQETENKYRFLYVADGLEHKNHHTLLKAWKIIHLKYNLNLELHLTVPLRFLQLISEIDKLNRTGLKIFNHGVCDQNILSTLYSKCNYLVFPSVKESFGLPLIEAAKSGCEVIAADLPYVYEVIKPAATFDPYNPENLADIIVNVITGKSLSKTEIVIDNQIDKLINLLLNEETNEYSHR